MNVATSGVSARGWQEVKGSTRNTWVVGGLRVRGLDGWGLEGLRVGGIEGWRVGGVEGRRGEVLECWRVERRRSGEPGHSR